MLVLTRKPGETIQIGKDIEITLVRIEGHRQVRIGVHAPQNLSVVRKELVSNELNRIESAVRNDK
jgi:carbon storage regulator